MNGDDQRIRRQQIEAQRRTAVLARRLQPVEQFDRRRARVRLAPRAGAQFHQRVRLLGPRRQHAARAMIFERAADQRYAIGQQRGGERVAGMAGEAASVEAESSGCARSIRPPLGQAGSCALAPPRLRAEAISWVRVSRVTTSQRRQPADVMPVFPVRAGGIVAQIDVVVASRGRRIGGGTHADRRRRDRRIRRRRARRNRDRGCASVQIGLRAGAAFVDQRAAGEAIEPECRH